MEGNGPIQGTPKTAGVMVAGSDPVAVDATCCRIMRIDPSQIGYLRLAAEARRANLRSGNPADRRKHRRRGHSFRIDSYFPVVSDRE